MAVYVLCHAVHDDVRAVRERVLQVRREEGVVDYDQDVVGVGDGGDGADVDEAERRVRGRFDPDQFRRGWLDQRGQVVRDAGREGHGDAVRGRHSCEIPVRSAVHVGHGDDVRALG